VNGIAGAVIVAENPADHHIFLSAFTGVRDLHATSGAVSAQTPRGKITIMDGTAFRAHFGVAPPVSRGARLAAMQFVVRDRAALTAALDAGGIEFASQMGHIVVVPAGAMGATLSFE